MIKWLKNNYKTYQVTQQIPYIFSVWIPFHLLAIVGIGLSILNWSWWYIAYLLVGWITFGGIGTAIMLHRYISHRAIDIRPMLKPILYWIACMSGQGSPIWWAALHRGYHHAHSDKEKDIHSPTKGFWHAYMGWMFTINYNSVSLRYAVEKLKDKQLMWFHKNYNKVIWISFLILFLFNPAMSIWFYIIPALCGLHTDSMVNSLCHTENAGYRIFDTKDHSENVWFLGYFGWGQGWHNNHHNDPRSFDFGATVSKNKKEFDPCMLLVPFISPWSEVKRIWSIWRASCRQSQ